MRLHGEWVRQRQVIQQHIFSYWQQEDISQRSYEKQREVYLHKFYRWCQKFQTKVSAHGGMNPVLRYPLQKVLEEPYLAREYRTLEPLVEDPAYARLFVRSSQGPTKRPRTKVTKHRRVQLTAVEGQND
jgi:hypothetical protein